MSLPNYIATTCGQTWSSNSDDVAQASLFDHQNLVDQLETAGVSWKAYMEDLPSPGDLASATPDGLYVRKHNPFLIYPDVYTDPARAGNVVPLTQLSTDLATGSDGTAVTGAVRARLLTVEAEWTRVAQLGDPDRWTEAAGAWDQLGCPWPAACARWRLAVALLECGGPREEAVVPLRQAWATAHGPGASPLLARWSCWPAAPGSRGHRNRSPPMASLA